MHAPRKTDGERRRNMNIYLAGFPMSTFAKGKVPCLSTGRWYRPLETPTVEMSSDESSSPLVLRLFARSFFCLINFRHIQAAAGAANGLVTVALTIVEKKEKGNRRERSREIYIYCCGPITFGSTTGEIGVHEISRETRGEKGYAKEN